MTNSKDMSGDLSHFRKGSLSPSKPDQQPTRLAHAESLQLHADLFEHAPVGYFIYNRKGRLEKVNEAGARMLGHEKNALKSKPILCCFSKSSRPKFFDHLVKVSIMGKKQACHLELLRANGTSFKAHFVTAPVTNPSGDFIHYRTIIVDMTDHRSWRNI